MISPKNPLNSIYSLSGSLGPKKENSDGTTEIQNIYYTDQSSILGTFLTRFYVEHGKRSDVFLFARHFDCKSRPAGLNFLHHKAKWNRLSKRILSIVDQNVVRTGKVLGLML